MTDWLESYIAGTSGINRVSITYLYVIYLVHLLYIPVIFHCDLKASCTKAEFQLQICSCIVKMVVITRHQKPECQWPVHLNTQNDYCQNSCRELLNVSVLLTLRDAHNKTHFDQSKSPSRAVSCLPLLWWARCSWKATDGALPGWLSRNWYGAWKPKSNRYFSNTVLYSKNTGIWLQPVALGYGEQHLPEAKHETNVSIYLLFRLPISNLFYLLLGRKIWKTRKLVVLE